MNKLIIAAAGSGKTAHLVKKALGIKNQNVLITTYTDTNEEEIKRKFISKNGAIPSNVSIQTWFSFLIKHGARPYQGKIFEEHINGLSLVNGQSMKGVRENDTRKYYFDQNIKIYSDKLSRFVCKCNEESKGAVVDRLARVYQHIFIDEI